MKIFFDFLPIFLFFAAFKLYDIYVATVVAIVSSIIQVGFSRIKTGKFETMHLVTLGLILVLGGATLLLQDKRFIMWKPTLVNWAFALAFLGSAFIGKKSMVERMMGSAIELPQQVWSRLNYAWVIFFIVIGLINIYVAFYYALELPEAEREAMWVNFKLFGMMGLTFLFVIGQSFFLARYMTDEDENSDEQTPTAAIEPAKQED